MILSHCTRRAIKKPSETLMNDAEPNRPEPLAARLTQLEELYTHFERMLEDLDGVVRQFERRLDTLEGTLKRLAGRVEGLSQLGEQPASLEDERPPHY